MSRRTRPTPQPGHRRSLLRSGRPLRPVTEPRPPAVRGQLPPAGTAVPRLHRAVGDDAVRVRRLRQLSPRCADRLRCAASCAPWRGTARRPAPVPRRRASARSACRRSGCAPARRGSAPTGRPAAPRASGPRGCRCARSRPGRSPPSLAIAPTICRGSTLCRLPTEIRYVAIGTSAGRRAARSSRAGRARPVAAPALLVVPRAAPRLPAAVERAGRRRLGLGLHQQRPVVLGQHRQRGGDVGRPARRAPARSRSTRSR